MKTHTNSFKEQIKEMGRELDSLITFGDTVLGNEELNAVTPSFQSSILKSAMKQLEIDSNVDIPVGTILNYKFGLKIEEGYEYLDFGKYVVYKSERQEDTLSYKITCYDKMLYTMKEYKGLENGTFPMSVRDYLTNLCLDCGLLFIDAIKEFANYDKVIESDIYADSGYTYRDILDELSQVTAGIICLNKNDSVEVRYINDTQDTINEEYFKDINVSFGKKYGPVNSIVLSRSGESDNVYLQDEESVELNGINEIKIIDNQIMNFNDRADYLPAILEKLNGLEYYINDFASTGIVYYDICDKYYVQIGDNTYPCIMFNNEVLVTQGLEENVYTELPKESETEYKYASKDDRKINQAYIIAKKSEGEIVAVASKVDKNIEEVANLKITTNEISTNVSKKVNGEDVVSTINQSAEQITLKGNRIVIESDNFNLSSDGTVQAVAGIIAGFNISKEGFYYLLQPKKDYENEDFIKLNNYIIGNGTLTDEEKYLYDMNNDGLLNVLDLNIMNWTIKQKISYSMPGKFQIKIPEEGKNPFALEFGLYNGFGEIINGFRHDESILQNLKVIGNLHIVDENSGNEVNVLELIKGENWQTATLNSAFKAYNDDNEYAPEYRRVGKIIEIRGTIKPSSEIASGGSATIFTLPEGYRPSKNVYTLCQGSSKNFWLLQVYPNGNVTFGRYGTNANASCPTSAWLPFSTTFTID